jgi:3-dehydroquinate synthase
MNVEGQACLEIVHGCASLKAQVVERDEYEQGERAILNAGHTIGHALEQAGNYRVFKHGEAILLGLLVETSISTSLGHLPPAECDRVEDLIMRIPLPRRQAVEHLGADLFPAIAKDKKNVSGQMRIPLIATIGKCELPIPVDRQTILRSLKSVKRRLVDHP